MTALLYLKWITSTAQGTLVNDMRRPGWEGGLGEMDTCICMAECPYCAPGGIAPLLCSSIK